MELRDSPHLPPGACALTGNSEGRMIDTLIDIDDLPPFGRLFVCEGAAATMAQMLGWEPPGTADRLRNENRRLRDELSTKDAALEAEVEANAALKRAGYKPKKETPVGV